MARLHAAWSHLDCLAKARRVGLHYLSGRIDVDLYLPLGCYESAADAAVLRDALQTALAASPEFGRVAVYYSE